MLKMNSVIDVFVSRELAANKQLNRTPTILRNAINQKLQAATLLNTSFIAEA